VPGLMRRRLMRWGVRPGAAGARRASLTAGLRARRASGGIGAARPARLLRNSMLPCGHCAAAAKQRRADPPARKEFRRVSLAGQPSPRLPRPAARWSDGDKWGGGWTLRGCVGAQWRWVRRHDPSHFTADLEGAAAPPGTNLSTHTFVHTVRHDRLVVGHLRTAPAAHLHVQLHTGKRQGHAQLIPSAATLAAAATGVHGAGLCRPGVTRRVSMPAGPAGERARPASRTCGWCLLTVARRRADADR
jgi:hypothetical protein